MSDVEKVCPRVAIIRRGEIVTVEEVETLRQKAGQRVSVDFGDVQRLDQATMQTRLQELERIPGVSNVTLDKNHYHFGINGTMDPLIKALSRYDVTRLQVDEAPLEEVFLKFYEDVPSTPASAPAHTK